MLTLALATIAQDPGPLPAAPTEAEQAYSASLTCASAYVVAGLVVGQMGDTGQQAELRRLADNFERLSVDLGQTLGIDRPSVIGRLAQASADRVAEANALAAGEDGAARMAAWGEELNQQLTVCRQFAARLAAN